MTRPTQEIDAYLDGEPTPEEARALQAWIQADRANAKAFLAAIRLHQQIGTQLRKDRFDQALRHTGQTATTKDGDAAIQALAELAKLEAQAETELVDLTQAKRTKQHAKRAANQDAISLNQLLDVSGYVLRRGLKSKATAITGLAAALLLALFIINPWSSESPDPIADNAAPKPTESAPPMPRDTPVATLTATHNALWAKGALVPGSALHPNQRLTLTQGYAEITTNRGAIAILESPCTVELIDNDNALRLHTGKLVGICETDASKGFLVRTPHMDVTDLGTRFGIDATQESATEVHVFKGEVQASRSGLGKLPGQLLTKGQAVKAQAGTVGLIDIKPDAVRFASVQMDDSKNANVLSPDAMEAGITRLAGGIAWSSRPPGLIPSRFELPAGKEAHVFAELRGHRLSADLPMTVHATGTTRQFIGITPRIVPAGTVIRSYFVCLNSGQDGGHAKSLGSIEFEGEVLGLICSTGDWQAFEVAMQDQSDAIFKFAREGLAPVLEGEDSITGQDELFISDDRHTLGLMLEGVDFAEILRVIVLEPMQEEKP